MLRGALIGITISASGHLAAQSLYVDVTAVAEDAAEYVALADIPKRVAALRKEMRVAAADLEFERAAELRDEIQRLQARELELRAAQTQ